WPKPCWRSTHLRNSCALAATPRPCVKSNIFVPQRAAELLVEGPMGAPLWWPSGQLHRPRNGLKADVCLTSKWVRHFLSLLGHAGRGRPMTESENMSGDRRNRDDPRKGERRKGGDPGQIPPEGDRRQADRRQGDRRSPDSSS